MHAVDTDVLVRYLTNDDPDQAARARRLLAREQVIVRLTVLLEAEWVLRAVYGFDARQVIAGLRGFAGLENVAVENAATAACALDWAEHGLDFADALNLAATRAHRGFISFDKALARAARKPGAPVVKEP
ncbi:MAG TPA: type II toxin-antitoxin system VapC family toxin [Acetobacteraceae bacterium]|jgi:predicted nucleic-acid-binding protein